MVDEDSMMIWGKCMRYFSTDSCWDVGFILIIASKIKYTNDLSHNLTVGDKEFIHFGGKVGKGAS
jgi:hypothetical protein